MIKKMKKHVNVQQPLLVLLVAILALSVGYGVANATLTGGGDIIDPPAIIADDEPGAVNTRQQAFAERQGVTLRGDTRCDRSILPAGTVVDSYMIFYNTAFNSPETDADRTWTFDEDVICVMSNNNGLYQAETDQLLGAPETTYPGPFPGRGLESNDSYQINGNTIAITMTAEEPGDWMRILTKVSTPADTTPPVVYCDPLNTTPSGKEHANKNENNGQNQNFFTLIGADDIDGRVDLFLTDTGSETVFGPFTAGDTVQLIEAKGATPSQETGGDRVDYKIKTNSSVIISATDQAGNENETRCGS